MPGIVTWPKTCGREIMDTYGKVTTVFLNRQDVLTMMGFFLNDRVRAHRLVLLSGLFRAALHEVGKGNRKDS